MDDEDFSSRKSRLYLQPEEAQPPRSFHLPILFALVPPLGSLFFGTTEKWADGVMLILGAFYLYHLVKIPWELYENALLRRTHLEHTMKKTSQSLRFQERLLFLFVLTSPLLGGLLLLSLQKILLTSSSRYLTPTNIFLYVLAASIRPLSHLTQKVQGSLATAHTTALFPSDEVSRLFATLDRMERELRDVRMSAVLRSDLEEVRDELEGAIESIARAVRQHSRKEDAARKTFDITNEEMEKRVRNVEEWCEVQRVQAAQQSLMVRCVWEPVTVLKEAVGVKRVPLLGFGGGGSGDKK